MEHNVSIWKVGDFEVRNFRLSTSVIRAKIFEFITICAYFLYTLLATAFILFQLVSLKSLYCMISGLHP